MESLTLTGLLKGVAAKFPSRRAISISGKFDITHARLDELVERAAARLLDAGVRPGDVVALTFPNTVEFVIMFLAVIRVRAVGAPLNKYYTSEEFEFYLSDSESKLLLTLTDGNAAAQAAASKLSIPHATVALTSESDVTISLNHPKSPESKSNSDNSEVSPINDPSDVALFLHTSGITSRPKGVPLSQLNLVSSVRNIKSVYKLTESDSTVIVLPLFHIHGLIAALLSSLGAGASVTLPAAGRFSVSTFWTDMKKSNATWYTAVPTIHQIIFDRHFSKPEPDYPTLRFIRSSSASLAPAVLNRLEEAFGAPVLEAYAMTEATHLMCTNPLPEDGLHKTGSVGQPVGQEMAILDENGVVQGTKCKGEVCVRGPNVMKGYKNNPEANKFAFRYGWFHTGYVGFLDEDGYLTLIGPITQGLMISPIEEDSFISSHPHFAQALDFTVADNVYGEEFPSSGTGMGRRGQSTGSFPSSTFASTSAASTLASDQPESTPFTVSKLLTAIGRNVDPLTIISINNHFGIRFPGLAQANGNHELNLLVDYMKLLYHGVVYLLTICSSVLKPSPTSTILSGAAVLLLVFGSFWALFSSLPPAHCGCVVVLCFLFVLYAATCSSLLEDHL